MRISNVCVKKLMQDFTGGSKAVISGYLLYKCIKAFNADHFGG